MSSYNKCVFVGRLTRDPEAKYTPSGIPVTSFSIAVDRVQSKAARQAGEEKQTDFFDIITWNQTAEFVAEYVRKGRLVLVDCRCQIRSYVTQDGQQRRATEFVASEVRPMTPRPNDEEGEVSGAGSRPAASGYGGSRPPAGGAPRPFAGGGSAARPPAQGGFGGGDDFDDLTDPFAE